MSESGYQQWLHVVPENGRVFQEIQEGEWIVWCEAPAEPPAPPPPPPASGTTAGVVGEHYYSIDWEFDGVVLSVTDLDVGISLDDEIG